MACPSAYELSGCRPDQHAAASCGPTSGARWRRRFAAAGPSADSCDDHVSSRTACALSPGLSLDSSLSLSTSRRPECSSAAPAKAARPTQPTASSAAHAACRHRRAAGEPRLGLRAAMAFFLAAMAVCLPRRPGKFG
eukprot:scaffold131497_cov63-Phaeocystis_antarctica.AAC.2